MGQKWKNRSTYGRILSKKIKKFDTILEEMAETLEETGEPTADDIKLYLDVSKTQDYSIQVQLSNIKRIEDFEILEKMENDRGPTSREIPTTEAIQNRIFR